MLRAVITLLSCMLLSSVAMAQKRVALVIGIDRYDNLDTRAQLKKARADAAAMADALRSVGFDVIHKEDATRSAFNSHWQDFLNKLAAGDTATFYFAGHGVELSGRNYLIPRDAPSVRPGRDELLKREALSVQEFLADLREKGTRLNLVILDACRDNPFDQVAGRSVGSTRGLAVTEPPEGTFIMFSAGSGETALDSLNSTDPDPNSVYTRRLLPLLKAQGISLTEVAEQVRVDVRQVASTVQHRQTPAYYNQVLGRVCLAGGDCIASGALRSATTPVRLSEAAEAWSAVKDTTSLTVLGAFTTQYKGTIYADLARARIEELKKPKVAATPPPSPQTREATRNTFEGEWELSATSQDCHLKQWKRRLTITGSQISGSKVTGQVGGNGDFHFTVPAAVDDKILGTFTGKFEGDAGKGTYKYPSCTGSVALKKL